MIPLGSSNDSAILRKGGPYYTKRVDANDFYAAYLNLTMEEVVAIAHNPLDMIKSCQFAGVPMYSPYCSELINGSTKMFVPLFGVCYGFNFQNVTSSVESVSSIYAGREFGLQLIVDIEGNTRLTPVLYYYSSSTA